MGDKQQALNYLNQALSLTRQVGNKAGEATTLLGIAVVEGDRGNLNKALTQIQAAIDIIENLRTKVDSQELRTSYFASVQGYYKFYIDGTDFTDDEVTNQTNDWALIQLNKPIGRKYGYFGWKSLPDSTLIKNQKKFIFVGYSGDFPNPKKRGYEFLSAGSGWTASFQQECSILGGEQNILFHDCDTTSGSSGGPIIGVINGQPYIVALNNAEIKSSDGKAAMNLAVKIDFLDRLSRGN